MSRSMHLNSARALMRHADRYDLNTREKLAWLGICENRELTLRVAKSWLDVVYGETDIQKRAVQNLRRGGFLKARPAKQLLACIAAKAESAASV